MKKSDKQAYLRSTQCLFTSPSKTALPGTKTRWDDLVSLHALHALQIHSTGQFLPWHRYYLHVHEKLLRSECGYKGPMAYVSILIPFTLSFPIPVYDYNHVFKVQSST